MKYYFLIILNINECDTGTHGCNLNTSTYMNRVGNSSCQCLSGFSLNHVCHQKATCMNNVGSFTCQCNTGFIANGISCDGQQSSILTKI